MTDIKNKYNDQITWEEVEKFLSLDQNYTFLNDYQFSNDWVFSKKQLPQVFFSNLKFESQSDYTSDLCAKYIIYWLYVTVLVDKLNHSINTWPLKNNWSRTGAIAVTANGNIDLIFSRENPAAFDDDRCHAQFNFRQFTTRNKPEKLNFNDLKLPIEFAGSIFNGAILCKTSSPNELRKTFENILN